MAVQWSEIAKELTCPVCQEDFNDPRILPCSHCYCLRCIEKLSAFSSPLPFSCPECREETTLPSSGPSQLPRALLAAKVAQTLRDAHVNAGMCPKHDEPKRLFCSSCDTLLCIKCTLLDHSDHTYHLAEDAANSFSKVVIEVRTELVQLKSNLFCACQANRNALAEVRKQGNVIAERINASFEEMSIALQQRRDCLLEVTNEFVKNKVCALDDQERAFQELISKIQKINETVDEIVADTNMLLGCHKSILSTINESIIESTSINLKPAATADMSVALNIRDRVASLIKAEWKVVLDTPADPSIKVNGIQSIVEVMCPMVVTVITQPAKDNVVTASLSSINSYGICDVFQRDPRTFEFTCCAVNRGNHTLHIEVNGQQLPGSPYSILATVPPNELGRLVRGIQLVHNPLSMAFGSDNDLVIAEFAKTSPRLVRIDRFGASNICCITSKYIVCPMGLAVDRDNNIFITDSASNMVLQFDKNGTMVKRIGGTGSLQGQFNASKDMIIVDNELFVCDAGNHRIQVFDLNLNFCRSFGSYGNKLGELCTPTDLAYSRQMDQLFVADSANQCIQVFTVKGRPVKYFDVGVRENASSGSHGVFSTVGGLFSNKEKPIKDQRPVKPTAICLDKTEKFLFIGDSNNGCVKVFTTTGTYVTSFCSKGTSYGQLQQPTRIALDNEGYVYVCDSENKCILVF